MDSLFPSLRFGGDYNPEQWTPDVWDEDVRLMRRAGVTTATVGVFAWAYLEPRPGVYEFGLLDDVLDRLHSGGIRVILATATASPPAWLAQQHPESLPVTADGVTLGFGSRQQFSASSGAYRHHALRLVEQLARRYGGHPALEAWHVGNEYGCAVPRSYDPESAAAFREWLRSRYGTIAELNRAWGTAFWSQAYGSFDQVGPPAAMPTFPNPGQLLDFDRFSSDALLALHRAEVEVLRSRTPAIPVTTNFMGFFKGVDYWSWASSVDVISDDSYPDPADPRAFVRLAASRDLMRSLGEGRPWLLMEQATSAVNWRGVNAPKPPGLNRVQSLQAVARGADGVLYFQWRQSAAGAEKFHSAMLPHAGEDTRVFREVEAIGAELAGLGHVLGQPVPASVAILFDWDSWRAIEQPATPARIDYVETVLAWYRPFLARGVTIDFVPPGADLSGYALVVAPVLHVVRPEHLEGLARYVQDGGHLAVTYQSAVLDHELHVYLDGYLGPLRETLGVRVEEFAPLPVVDPADHLGHEPAGAAGAPTTSLGGELAGVAGLWQDVVRVVDAEVVATFLDGHAGGGPAITRRGQGAGSAWYVATQPAPRLLDDLAARLLDDASVTPLLVEPVDGVEAVRRGSEVFLINHTGREVELLLTDGPRSVGAVDGAVVRVDIREGRHRGTVVTVGARDVVRVAAG